MSYSDKGSRKLSCIVSVGPVALLAALLAIWQMGRPYTSTLPRAFASLAWKEADPTGWPADDTRCSMVADLQMRVGVEGKTRDELVRLLGEPEKWRSEPADEYWPLCPSFLDIWVLTVRWKDGRAFEAIVHDT